MLDAADGATPLRILSLCAGDGRDVLPALAARPALVATTTLVEIDDRLVADARHAPAAAEQGSSSTSAPVGTRLFQAW